MAPITWKVLFDRGNHVLYVNPEKKDKYKEAVRYLKAEMGNGFFKNCGIDHPVRQKLTNLPSLLDDALHFVDTLKILENTESNYKQLLSKIRPLAACRDEGRYFMVMACEHQSKNGAVEK
jgi:hypothetical protein